jgi:lysophospholipid acyltransferase (LPLAT)-like uncharacterized protein
MAEPLLSRRRYRMARRTVGGWALRRLGPTAMRRLARTWRTEELGREHREALGPDAGFLICLWHGRMLMGMDFFGRRDWRVLVSTSDDGDLSESMLRRFGYGVIRGSASRGGPRALREMLTALRAGEKVILTPDGPRGPAHSMNPGVAWLARATGHPILPIGLACDRAWRLHSWDRFTIPKPNARVVFSWGEPVVVARDAGERELEHATALVREGLHAAEGRSFERLGLEPET